MLLHCNSIEFVGQKHCFLLATAICLKSTYCCNSFSTSFLLHRNKVHLSYSHLCSFQPKGRIIFPTYYIYEKKKVTFKRECVRSCVRGAQPFRLLHNAQSRNRRRVSRLFRDVLYSFLSTLDNQERRYLHARAHRLPR